MQNNSEYCTKKLKKVNGPGSLGADGRESRVGGGRGEGIEKVELPDSLVEKAVSQTGGAGKEAAVASSR